MTTKQHQILAVEPTRKAAADTQLDDCTNTFSKKGTLFNGQIRTLTMFDSSPEKMAINEAIIRKDAIDTPVQNTVPDNLNYMAGVVGSWVDVVFTKEMTNQIAVADVVIDGKVIVQKAPATFLLFLENNLKKVRGLYEALPTLAPGIEWAPATDKGRNIFKSPAVSTLKTEKIVEMIRQEQRSDKFPDTFVEKSKDVPVGEYKATQFSAMISVADKAEILARFDRFLMAVKDARMRANDVQATLGKCSTDLFAYIHGGFHDELMVKAATAS
jgi:hypothetical protein